MKILMLVHSYYPDQSGVQAVTQYIAEGLAVKHEITVITELRQGLEREEIVNGVSVIRIIANRKYVFFAGEKSLLYKIIKGNACDVLICVCTQSWTFDWIKREIAGIPCKKILYTHGYSGYKEHYNIIYNLLKGKLMTAIMELYWKCYYANAYRYIEQFDMVTYLAVTDKAVQYAHKHNIKNGQILGNAVEDIFFENPHPNIAEYYLENKQIIYLYVANYFHEKGQEMVLNAFYQANVPNSKLIFVGSDWTKYLEKVMELKETFDKQYGLKKVSFLYKQTRQQVYQLYDKADIFVCGSMIEAYPIMLCEAAAKGLAIISTKVGNASLIAGAEIISTDQEMSKKMELLYNHSHIRRLNGKKARTWAENNCIMREKVQWMEEQLEHLVNQKS